MPGEERTDDLYAQLSRYEELWDAGDLARLQAEEEHLLGRLARLRATEVAALAAEGLSARSINLVLIVIENGLRGPRRPEFETALVVGMEKGFEQPDRLEFFAEMAARFGVAPPLADRVVYMLKMAEPSGLLAESLGAVAASMESAAREEVRRYALERRLPETLAYLVDAPADVIPLQAMLAQPDTAVRARRALRIAGERARDPVLRSYVDAVAGGIPGSRDP